MLEYIHEKAMKKIDDIFKTDFIEREGIFVTGTSIKPRYFVTTDFLKNIIECFEGATSSQINEAEKDVFVRTFIKKIKPKSYGKRR